MEIHNAVYDGAFIQAAKHVLDKIDLEQFGVFRDSEFTRMADLHFVLLIMATIENGGYFAQDREVEPMIAKFNDDYPAAADTIDALLGVFDLIKSLELPPDSIWFRKSNFFTLVVELATHFEELPRSLRKELITLEERILDSKTDFGSEYAEYYSYMYQATHGRSARLTRARFFERDVLGVRPT